GIRDRHVTGVQTCALPICVEGGWDASWRLVSSPVVSTWAAESLPRCHGLVATRSELDHLLSSLADQHARAALAPLAADRRSSLGEALVVGGDLRSGGKALAEAVRDFGRAAAARDVEVVLRIMEPGGGGDETGSAAAEETDDSA